MFKVEIIKHSRAVTGKEIVTALWQYPRFIHSEVKTHRVFSGSSMSSRAVPVAKMIAEVRDDPAMPVHWGKNQKGMQAKEQLEGQDLEAAKLLWTSAAHNAAVIAEQMAFIGLHKQVANRILEPFQWMRTVITGTEWDNFYELRDHEDADPNFHLLAKMMREAHTASVPVDLNYGEWHLPFMDSKSGLLSDRQASAARCARTSYLTHEGKEPNFEEDLGLFNRLAESRPRHSGPLEHQAEPALNADYQSGNLRGFVQFRKQWEAANA